MRVARMVACVLLAGLPMDLAASAWTNRALAPSVRANLLLAEMTLDEKILLVHGSQGPGVGNITNIARLGFPSIHFQDGPAGIAQGMQGVTALPAPIALAASWDPGLARAYGTLLGTEARGKNIHVLLGPMINMVRAPHAGRNFEVFGEDPFLTSAIAAEYIRGIQSNGVIACAKAFVCNDQETARGNINVNVDLRTMHEIYFPPFLAAVRAGAGSIMTAYNSLNGWWASETPLLGTILKVRWGFDGFTVCDWSANFSPLHAARNGLDLEMPADAKFGIALRDAIQADLVREAQLDEMVHRLLCAFFRFGIWDDPLVGDPQAVVTNPSHAQFAYQAASEGMVLLKNSNGILPLDTNTLQSVAVIGQVGGDGTIWTGHGSAHVYLPYYDIPALSISNRLGPGVAFHNGTHPTNSIADAVALAQQAEVAIVFAGEQTGEGSDRTNLFLPQGQDDLISAVAAVNTNTIVVLYVGSGTLMPWLDDVAAVLVVWYPGQENGRPLASVLAGDVNPSGKLPVTFPASETQTPLSTPQQFPGTNLQVFYSEQLLAGYRWHDASNTSPLFPFGHGLSYTTFGYSNLVVGTVSPAGRVDVTVEVTNTGPRPGAEVVQLYLGFPSGSGEPPQQLKGFRKVWLGPGETRQVRYTLNWEDLACWDPAAEAWSVPLGNFAVRVGASSRDIRQTGSITVSNSIPSNGMANHALFKDASASSAQTNNPARKAFDGDPQTFWSPADMGWQDITVDLGRLRPIIRTRVHWGTNFAAQYEVRCSTDNTNWITTFSTANGVGGVEEVLASHSARFIQLRLFQSGASAAQLGEMEVFASERHLTPEMQMSRTATNAVRLAWPVTWEGSILKQNAHLDWENFILERASAIGTTNWSPTTASRSVEAGTNVMTLPIGLEREFFRLRAPNRNE